MIVLDTTVLLYAKGADHPLRDPCREIVRLIADGRLRGTTTVEVVQEFVHVRARRRGREDAVRLGQDYADLLSPLLPVTVEHLRDGLRNYQHLDRLGAFDAVLAAATIDVGAEALVSADANFAAVTALTHVHPDESGVSSLLR